MVWCDFCAGFSVKFLEIRARWVLALGNYHRRQQFLHGPFRQDCGAAFLVDRHFVPLFDRDGLEHFTALMPKFELRKWSWRVHLMSMAVRFRSRP